MHSILASVARTRLEQLLDEIAAAHAPVTLVTGRTNAVLISSQDWEDVQLALHPGAANRLNE